MASRNRLSHSPPPLPVPQNTPYTSGPQTTTGTPTTSQSHGLSILTTYLLSRTSLAHAPNTPPKTSTSTSTNQPPSITTQISSLALHPTLETTLHILNSDLPSAHFLARHMSAPPATEGMLLHSILHRCEGDFRNARAWLSDVEDAVAGWVPKRKGSEELKAHVVVAMGMPGGDGHGEDLTLLEFVYEGMDGGAQKLIDDVESFRMVRGNDRELEHHVEDRIRTEMQRIIQWCTAKFGDGEWEDASGAWARPGDEVAKIGRDMVSGKLGWRKF
ncbi:hypothetical protein B0J11DRAFT_542769 [Dendryphion nanum]|uniref:Uncharacterized protein n=1 Tax=Dendryphion nanum TaxID=256645 RepID=A0A9P9I8W4_9PLEO|nr:hypothetical protein B0J11DRAFT_542769 [Dendryphion nanum]